MIPNVQDTMVGGWKGAREPMSWIRQILVPVTEGSLVAEARRTAAKLSADLGFSPTDLGRIALIVTELGTNLVKHALDGRLLMRAWKQDETAEFEILSVDSGPGMADQAKSFRDGQSTAGSPGTGLGTIMRQATEWDCHTQVGKGTVLMARLRAGDRVPSMTVGVVHQPKPGEAECGDAWYAESSPEGWLCAVVDGLGHGPDAAKASRFALTAIHSGHRRTVSEYVAGAHEAARPTRGAAIGIASLDRSSSSLSYAGVGNIAAVVIDHTQRRSLVSSNGILGHQMRKVTQVTHPWSTQALLVMHSDGLGTQWNLGDYPGLQARDPGVIAGVLYRDFVRGRDDVTVVIMKDGYEPA